MMFRLKRRRPTRDDLLAAKATRGGEDAPGSKEGDKVRCAAAWEQLLGRWYRQGQQRDVEVIVPITVMQTSQGPSSLDLVRLYRIAQRGSLADAVCDGDLPTHVGSASELTAAARQELEKLITQKEDNK